MILDSVAAIAKLGAPPQHDQHGPMLETVSDAVGALAVGGIYTGVAAIERQRRACATEPPARDGVPRLTASGRSLS